MREKKLVMKQYQIKWHHKTRKQQVKIQKKTHFCFCYSNENARKKNDKQKNSHHIRKL